MPRFQQNFQDASGQVFPAFERLVGIGRRAQCNGRAEISRFGQFGAQQPWCVRLGENLRLEIEAWREAQPGVRGPGIAIDAAVFAAR